MRFNKIGALLIVLVLASPALAQRDRLGIGESLGGLVIRGPGSTAPEFSVELHQDAVSGVVSEMRGELTYAKLPRHVQAVHGFLIRWGRGPSTMVVRANPDPATPVEVAGAAYALREVRLRPPVRGYTTVRGPDGQVQAVRVGAMTVETPGGPGSTAALEVHGPGTVWLRQEPDGWWTVTKVTLP